MYLSVTLHFQCLVRLSNIVLNILFRQKVTEIREQVLVSILNRLVPQILISTTVEVSDFTFCVHRALDIGLKTTFKWKLALVWDRAASQKMLGPFTYFWYHFKFHISVLVLWYTQLEFGSIVLGLTRSSTVAGRPRDASCHWIFSWVGQCRSRSLKMIPFESMSTISYSHSEIELNIGRKSWVFVPLNSTTQIVGSPSENCHKI